MIYIVMRYVLEDVLQKSRLFPLFLYTRVEQGEMGNMGNRPILGSGRRTRWHTLQVCLGAFSIEIIENIDELLAHKCNIFDFPPLFGRERPFRNLLYISHQPNAQASR